MLDGVKDEHVLRHTHSFRVAYKVQEFAIKLFMHVSVVGLPGG